MRTQRKLLTASFHDAATWTLHFNAKLQRRAYLTCARHNLLTRAEGPVAYLHGELDSTRGDCPTLVGRWVDGATLLEYQGADSQGRIPKESSVEVNRIGKHSKFKCAPRIVVDDEWD